MIMTAKSVLVVAAVAAVGHAANTYFTYHWHMEQVIVVCMMGTVRQRKV